MTMSLDEPVTATLMRDLSRVAVKLRVVLLPQRGNAEDHVRELRDWDLWGPLLICLLLAVLRSFSAPDDQSSFVFAAIFFLVWFGACVVTLNAQLLGAQLSFFQSCSVLGYCIFPLCLALFITELESSLLVRLLVVGAALVWSVRASTMFVWQMASEERRALVLYPVGLFYAVLSWIIIAQ
jgi:hypothetical protein